MTDQTTAFSKLPQPSRGGRVWVIGGSNMDISAQTPTALVRGDSTPGQVTCSPGGVARNVAENLVRLGISTHLISVVGDDLFGQRLRQDTAAVGVVLEGLVTLPGKRTATYLSLHGPDGDMAVAVNDMDILLDLNPDLLQRFAPSLNQAACWVADCNLAPPALQWLFDNAQQILVFVDAVSVAKCQKILPWLDRIHTLKANRLEAEILSGLPIHDVTQAQGAARHLHDTGIAQVVISLGEQGVCWCDGAGETGHRAASRVNVVNTSGAGDALLAGLVHGHLTHSADIPVAPLDPLASAVEFAMACAEITVGSPHANARELSAEAVYSRLAKKPFENQS